MLKMLKPFFIVVILFLLKLFLALGNQLNGLGSLGAKRCFKALYLGFVLFKLILQLIDFGLIILSLKLLFDVTLYPSDRLMIIMMKFIFQYLRLWIKCGTRTGSSPMSLEGFIL